ncbi:MAG: hypothetical protein ACK56W_01525 [Pirellula sp.]|jgi:hypothetical protein
MQASSIVLVFFGWLIHTVNAGDYDVLDAKEAAGDYVAHSILEMPRYLMVADVTVEASPESPLLFESKGKMIVLSTASGFDEECSWRPTIIADDRDKKKRAETVFASMVSMKRMERAGERVVDIGETGLERMDEGFNKGKFVPVGGRCIRLFDWPLHGESCFRTSLGVPNMPEISFGKDRICFHAKELAPETIESYWAVKGAKPVGFQVATFKKALPVKNEYYLSPKVMDLELVPSRKGAKCFAIVETRWKDLGGTMVPDLVKSVLFDNPWKSDSNVELIAKITVYDDKSKEYQEASKNFETKWEAWKSMQK